MKLLGVFAALLLVGAAVAVNMEALDSITSGLNELNQHAENKAMLSQIQALVEMGATGVAKLVELINNLINDLLARINSEKAVIAKRGIELDAAVKGYNDRLKKLNNRAAELTADNVKQTGIANQAKANAAASRKLIGEFQAAVAKDVADIANLNAKLKTSEADCAAQKANNDNLIALFLKIQDMLLKGGFAEQQAALAELEAANSASNNTAEVKSYLETAIAALSVAADPTKPAPTAAKFANSADYDIKKNVNDQDMKALLQKIIDALKASEVQRVDKCTKEQNGLKDSIKAENADITALNSRIASETKSAGDNDAKAGAAAATIAANNQRLSKIASQVSSVKALIAVSQQNFATANGVSQNRIGGWEKQIAILREILKMLNSNNKDNVLYLNKAIKDLDVAAPTWSAGVWGACSSKCGAGTQTRTVTCKPGYEGSTRECDASAKPAASQACNPGPCPIDCVAEWSNQWSNCPSCGGGSQSMSQVVKVQAQFGGKPCNLQTQSRACNSAPCYVYQNGQGNPTIINLGSANGSPSCVNVNLPGVPAELYLVGDSQSAAVRQIAGANFTPLKLNAGLIGQQQPQSMIAAGYNTGYPAHNGDNDYFRWDSALLSNRVLRVCATRLGRCCANGGWGQYLQLAYFGKFTA